ncbi:helicase 2 [Orgyia pseudotsugata single capsid nuclopolyhedrovirus]|nr:helicase 2 [Orgyia pseudotsugata single capsid nuclopolyhedrovirus]
MATPAKRQRVNSADVKLNIKQQLLFDFLTQATEFRPLFVSGCAGTGKSALLRALRNFWTRQNETVYVAAYTNLAARNVDGKTCHSLFGFDFKLNVKRPFSLKVPHCLILDEISMIPGQMLDKIDEILKRACKNDEKPFGGVNLVVFGDLYQLPPVDKNDTMKPVYEAKVWPQFTLYELTENMRQSEALFIDNLNMLRTGDAKCVEYFNTLTLKTPPTVENQLNNTCLVSTHNESNSINVNCYNAITIDQVETVVRLNKRVLNRKSVKRDTQIFNVEQENMIFKSNLKLCPGTRIMVTHTTNNFCNGDFGIVESVSGDGEKTSYTVIVRREYDNQVMMLQCVVLYFFGDNAGQVTRVTGLPLTYGWAVTIHKAQGMSLKNLIVYPACVFAPGHAYVALSRSVHSSGLKLVSALPRRAICDMSHVTAAYKLMPRIRLDD